jgi:hypothetical protein
MDYIDDAYDHYPTRLSIDDLGTFAAEWRERAQHADLTSLRVADALESEHMVASVLPKYVCDWLPLVLGRIASRH